MEIPVYLFTGFLESGKTKFIQETLEDPRFTDGTSTLVLVCEQGEIEYNENKYPAGGVHIEYIESEEDLNDKNLEALRKKHKAKRVIVEYNGMWQNIAFFYAMPKDWMLYQEMCFVDSTTFKTYNANMRSLVVDKFTTPDRIVFNRYLDKYDKLELHKAVRGCSRSAEIIYEYPNGEAVQDDIEDPLPFDKEADSFEIEDNDFALWYRDMSECLSDYKGKTVTACFLVLNDKSMEKDCAAVGRRIMTCCVEDIQFSGLVCHFPDGNMPKDRSWVRLTGKIDIRYNKAYGKEGPVIDCVSFTPCSMPDPEVATFY